MKIVHSFWTKPALREGVNVDDFDRIMGGWYDRRFSYMSWMLSFRQFNTFYPTIELVSDEIGCDILIDKLKLPYTSVRCVLDELNDYPGSLWALGKIKAYSLQDEPFLHVDSDVYIWEKFASRLIKAPLVSQNIEYDFPYYIPVMREVHDNFAYIPEAMIKEKHRTKKIIACNAGVFGGNDTKFFKKYTDEAFKMINKNLDYIAGMKANVFNTIYEQVLFWCMAKEADIEVAFVKEDIDKHFDGISELTGTPIKNTFVHLLGINKRSLEKNRLMEYRLHSAYPDDYYLIMNLLANNQL
jgi:hypothetical protein